MTVLQKSLLYIFIAVFLTIITVTGLSLFGLMQGLGRPVTSTEIHHIYLVESVCTSERPGASEALDMLAVKNPHILPEVR